jgi:hypothetical protein
MTTLALESTGVSGVYPDRLAFELPEFTRVSWVGEAARAAWQDRLARIKAAWLQVEWQSVVDGVRPCAVLTRSPEQLVAQAETWAEHGLHAVPVDLVGSPDGKYLSSGVPYVPGRPFNMRLALGSAGDALALRRALREGNQQLVGQLLGYPACCRAFFDRVWVGQGLIDTTWPMAASSGRRSGEGALEVRGPVGANVLWRWVGVRAVPHLPCRFDCEATVALSEQLLAVGRTHGFGVEMDWLCEVLSWPVEWSALHGIAEIKTPLLKISTRTDATAGKYTVRRLGDSYPSEGAQGVGFPYRQSCGIPLTASRAYQRGLEHPLPMLKSFPRWYASDNGFPDRWSMEAAHAPIVSLARSALGEAAGVVLDLGCGNGALLGAILDACPTVEPLGVDADPERVAHARELLPRWSDRFLQGDLLEADAVWSGERDYALVVLMPGRLLEAEPSRADRLRAHLRQRAAPILVYAYGDWLARFGSLTALAEAAGLEIVEHGEGVGLARVRASAAVPLTSTAARPEDTLSRESEAGSPRPRRVEDVQAEVFDGELLLYEAGRGQVVRLNASAAAVWELLDGHRTVDEMADELGEALGCSASRLHGDIVQAVERLLSLGLVSERAGEEQS